MALTYSKILRRLKSLQPGESVTVDHPDSVPNDRMRSHWIQVRRAGSDELAPEYSCLEYEGGAYYPGRDFRTDSAREMAKYVVLWLNLGAAAHVIQKALALAEKRAQ